MQYHSATLPEFWKYYKSLDKQTQSQAKDAFRRFKDDPENPGLNFERMKSNRDLCSARVNVGIRAGGVIRGDTITWFFIGSHSEWDRLIKSVRT